MAFDPNTLNYGDRLAEGYTNRTLGIGAEAPTTYDPLTIDPKVGSLRKNPQVLDDIRELARARGKTYASDDEMFDDFMSSHAWASLNTVAAAFGDAGVAGTLKLDPATRERAKRLQQVWDRVPSFWEEGGRGTAALTDIIGALVLDPVNLIPVASGSAKYAKIMQHGYKAAVQEATAKIGAEASKEAIEAATQQAMRDIAQSAALKQLQRTAMRKGAAAGAVSEAAVNAVAETIFDGLTQARDIQLGISKEYSPGQTAGAAAIGAGFGLATGGAFGAAGARILGPRRAANEFAKEVVRSHGVASTHENPSLADTAQAAIQAEGDRAKVELEARREEALLKELGHETAANSQRSAYNAADIFSEVLAPNRAAMTPEQADAAEELRKIILASSAEDHEKTRKALLDRLDKETDAAAKGEIRDQLDRNERVFRVVNSVDPADPDAARGIVRSLLKSELGIDAQEMPPVAPSGAAAVPGAGQATPAAQAPAAASPAASPAATEMVKTTVEALLGETPDNKLPIGTKLRTAAGDVTVTENANGDIYVKHTDGRTEVIDPTVEVEVERPAAAKEQPQEAAAKDSGKKGRGKKPAPVAAAKAAEPAAEPGTPATKAVEAAGEATDGSTTPAGGEAAEPAVSAIYPTKGANREAERQRLDQIAASMSEDDYAKAAKEEMEGRGWEWTPGAERAAREMHAMRSTRAKQAADLAAEVGEAMSEEEVAKFGAFVAKLGSAKSDRQVMDAFADLADLDAPIAVSIMDPILRTVGSDQGARINAAIHAAARFNRVSGLIDKYAAESGTPTIDFVRLRSFLASVLPGGFDEHDARMMASHLARLDAVAEDTVTPDLAHSTLKGADGKRLSQEEAAKRITAIQENRKRIAAGLDRPVAAGADDAAATAARVEANRAEADAALRNEALKAGLTEGDFDDARAHVMAFGLPPTTVRPGSIDFNTPAGIFQKLTGIYYVEPTTVDVETVVAEMVNEALAAAPRVERKALRARLTSEAGAATMRASAALSIEHAKEAALREAQAKALAVIGVNDRDLSDHGIVSISDWRRPIQVDVDERFVERMDYVHERYNIKAAEARTAGEGIPDLTYEEVVENELIRMAKSRLRTASKMTEQQKADQIAAESGASHGVFATGARRNDAPPADTARGENLVGRFFEGASEAEDELVRAAYREGMAALDEGDGFTGALNRVRAFVSKHALDGQGSTKEGFSDARFIARVAYEALHLRADFDNVAKGIGSIETNGRMWERASSVERHAELKATLKFIDAELEKHTADSHQRSVLLMNKSLIEQDLGVGEFAQSSNVGRFVEKYQRALSWARDYNPTVAADAPTVNVRINRSAARSARRAVNRRILERLSAMDTDQFQRTERLDLTARGAKKQRVAAMKYLYGDATTDEGKAALGEAIAVVKASNKKLMEIPVLGQGDLLGAIARGFANGDADTVMAARQLVEHLTRDLDAPELYSVSRFLASGMAAKIESGALKAARSAGLPPKTYSVQELALEKNLGLTDTAVAAIRDITGDIEVASANDAWRAWDVLHLNPSFDVKAGLSVATNEGVNAVIGALEALAPIVKKFPRRLSNADRGQAMSTVRMLLGNHHIAEQTAAVSFLARVAGDRLPRIYARLDVPANYHSALRGRIFGEQYGAMKDGEWVVGARPAGQEGQAAPLVSAFGGTVEEASRMAQAIFDQNGTYVPPLMRLHAVGKGMTKEVTGGNSVVIDMAASGVRGFVHETGHWAYFNVLSVDDQVKFWRTLRDEYYDDNGDFLADKFRSQMGVDPSTIKSSYNKPSEMFAYLFERWVMQENKRMISPVNSRSFREAADGFTGIFRAVIHKMLAIYERLVSGKLAPIPSGLEDLFERIMPEGSALQGYRAEFPDSHLREHANPQLHRRGKELSLIEMAISDLEVTIQKLTSSGGLDADDVGGFTPRELVSKLSDLSTGLARANKAGNTEEASRIIAESNGIISRMGGARDLSSAMVVAQNLLNQYNKGTRFHLMPGAALNASVTRLSKDATLADGFDIAGALVRLTEDGAEDAAGSSRLALDLDQLAQSLNPAASMLEDLRGLHAYKLQGYRDTYHGRQTGVSEGPLSRASEKSVRRNTSRFLRSYRIGTDLLNSLQKNPRARELVASEMAAGVQPDGLLLKPPSALVNVVLGGLGKSGGLLQRWGGAAVSAEEKDAALARARLAAYRIMRVAGVLDEETLAAAKSADDIYGALPSNFGATAADKKAKLRDMAKRMAMGENVDLGIEEMNRGLVAYVNAGTGVIEALPTAEVAMKRRIRAYAIDAIARDDAAHQLQLMTSAELENISRFTGGAAAVRFLGGRSVAPVEARDFGTGQVFGTGHMSYTKPLNRPAVPPEALAGKNKKQIAAIKQLVVDRENAISKIQAGYRKALEGEAVGEDMILEAMARVEAIEKTLFNSHGIATADTSAMVFVRSVKPLDLSRGKVHVNEVLPVLSRLNRQVAETVADAYGNAAEEAFDGIPATRVMSLLVEAASQNGKVTRAPEKAREHVYATLKKFGYDSIKLDDGRMFTWDNSNVIAIDDARVRVEESGRAPDPDLALDGPELSSVTIKAATADEALSADDLVAGTLTGSAPEVSASTLLMADLASGRKPSETIYKLAAATWENARGYINLNTPATHLSRRRFNWLSSVIGASGDFNKSGQVGLYDEYWRGLAKRMDGVNLALNAVPNRGGALKRWARSLKFTGDLPQSKSDARINEALRLAASGMGDGEITSQVWGGVDRAQVAAEKNAVRAIQDAFRRVPSEANELGLTMGNLGPNFYPQTMRADMLAKHRSDVIDFFTDKFVRERREGNLPAEMRDSAVARSAATRMVDNMINGGGFWMPPMIDKRVPYAASIDHHRVLNYSADEMRNAVIGKGENAIPLRNMFVNHLETNLYNYFSSAHRRLQWVEKFGPNGHMVSDYMQVISDRGNGIMSLLSRALESTHHETTAWDIDGSSADVFTRRTHIAPVAENDGHAASLVADLKATWRAAKDSGDGDVYGAVYQKLVAMNHDPIGNDGWNRRADAIARAISDFGDTVFGDAPPPTPQDMGYVGQFLKLAAGGSLHDYNNRAHQASKFLRSVNAVTLLGASTITSLNDVTLPLVRSGEFKAYMTAVSKLASDPEYRQFLRRTGVAMENIVHQRLANMHGVSNRMTNAYFGVNGMTPWTTTMRQLAGAVAFESFSTWQRIVAGADKQSRKYRRAKRSLEHFGLFEVAQMRSFDDPEMMLDDKVAAAIHRFAQETIFSPDASEIPPWARSPLGALVFQFKSFPLMYGRLAGYAIDEFKRFVKGDGGSAAPLAYLLGASVGVGAGATAVKDYVLSRGGDDNRSPETRKRLMSKTLESFGFKGVNFDDERWDKALGIYVEGFMHSGGLGLLTDIMYTTADMADNGDYGAWRIAGAIGGPGVGQFRDAIKVYAGATTSGETNAAQRGAVRSLAARIPIIGSSRGFREAVTDEVAGPVDDGKGGFSGFGNGFKGF